MRRRAAAGLVLGLLLAATTFVGTSGVAAAPAPVFTIDRTSAAEGELVRLQGVGFGAPGTTVTILICGNNALDDSADCNLAASTQAAVRDGGTFAAGITVFPPPTPCPCVVRVTAAGGALTVDVPIAIDGVPTAPLRPDTEIVRTVTISDVAIEGSGPVASWFGAPPERSIVFSVTNNSPVVLRSPRTLLTWGRDGDGDGFMPSPDLGDLAPGQTTTAKVEIPLPAASVGSYEVTVRVDPIGGTPATATTQTTIVPWGWILIGLIILQMILLKIRNRYRRRVQQQADENEASMTPGTSAPPEVSVG